VGRKTCTALLAHQAQRQPDAALRALGSSGPGTLKAGIVDTRARLAEALDRQRDRRIHQLCREHELLGGGHDAHLASRFPTLESAQPYVGKPVDLANFVYGARMGNQLNGTNDNDGWDCRAAA
jgi:putative chitinase